MVALFLRFLVDAIIGFFIDICSAKIYIHNMKDGLAYALITPHTIVKSRTGGVISRMLSRVDLEFCGAQIFAPDLKLVERYALAVRTRQSTSQTDSQIKILISDYILSQLSPSEGRRHRTMMLLFRGENACKKLSDVVGALYPQLQTRDSLTGETIRDTYADLVMSPGNPSSVSYFEPAILTPPNQTEAKKNLAIFADFIRSESNLVENVRHPYPEKIERTLVIIKPDNWRYPSSKPGTIIDMFSRTGLRIIGCKLVQMSIAESLEFYGPVKRMLETKLSSVAARQARQYLEEHFNLTLSDAFEQTLSETFGAEYAEEQFNRIIEFMSGNRPTDFPREEWERPGSVKSMVLVYEGVNAVQKIRSVLGPTDPTQAPGGTVRKEFGSDVMVNTAHASDSVENAVREMEIVNIQQNPLASLIDTYLKTS